MSFILSLFGDRRGDQLIKEGLLYGQLHEKCSTCSDTLALFYKWRVDVNREQFFKVSDAPFYNKHCVIEENLNEIDSVLVDVEKGLQSDNVCEYLKYIIDNKKN